MPDDPAAPFPNVSIYPAAETAVKDAPGPDRGAAGLRTGRRGILGKEKGPGSPPVAKRSSDPRPRAAQNATVPVLRALSLNTPRRATAFTPPRGPQIGTRRADGWQTLGRKQGLKTGGKQTPSGAGSSCLAGLHSILAFSQKREKRDLRKAAGCHCWLARGCPGIQSDRRLARSGRLAGPGGRKKLGHRFALPQPLNSTLQACGTTRFARPLPTPRYRSARRAAGSVAARPGHGGSDRP